MTRFVTSGTRERVLELRKRRPTTAEVVGAQVEAAIRGQRRTAAAAAHHHDDDDDDDMRGAVQDYDFTSAYANVDEGNDDDGDDDMRSKTARSTQRTSSDTSNGSSARRARAVAAAPLRRRGPLDAALSHGRYAAAPVRNVEAAVDDLFSALDMRDMDAEDNEEVTTAATGSAREDDDDDGDDDDDDARARTSRRRRLRARDDADTSDTTRRRVRRAKDLSEDEYTAWLEQKLQQKKATTTVQHDDHDNVDDVDADAAQHVSDTHRDEDDDDAALASYGDEETNILRQLASVRRAQQQTRPPRSDTLTLVQGVQVTSASSQSNDDSATRALQRRREQAQAAVRHYYMLYTQLLRLRVKLQPAVIKAVALPQYYAYPLFTTTTTTSSSSDDDGDDDDDEQAVQCTTTAAAARAYADVRAELHDTLASLRACAAAVHARDDDTDGDGRGNKTTTSSTTNLRVVFDELTAYHTRTRTLADACLEYWGGRLLAVRAASTLKAVAQPLPQQIRAILAVRTRLRAKVQRNRAHLRILGHPEHLRLHAATATTTTTTTAAAAGSDDATSDAVGERTAALEEAKARRALHVAEGDGDEEVFDDGDFVRELVHRAGGVRAQQLQEQLATVQRELQSSARPSRKGFHRLTKGKSVNYDPMPALVGFCVAETYEGSGRNDVVVASLFQ